MFRLAHVTDPHFRAFAGITLGDFVGKRAIGAANLLVNRSRKHDMGLLAALREDLKTREIDHLAITGDVGNLSLEAEWQEGRRWIEAYGGAPEAVTVIPGNHDTYVAEAVASHAFERIFAPYQTGELRQGSFPYPFVRLRKQVALFAINTCVPTGDLGAWGEIGKEQLARLETLMAAPELSGMVRVVLLHHPPVVHRPPEHRNLRDRSDLVALLARTGAELVLHGHDHRDEMATLPGPGASLIPVVGAGSASYVGPVGRSRFNVYEIADRSITAVTYAHHEASGRYVEARRVRLPVDPSTANVH